MSGKSDSGKLGVFADSVFWGAAHSELVHRIVEKVVEQIRAQQKGPAVEVKAADIARYLGCRDSWVTRLTKNGVIPRKKTISVWLYAELNLDKTELDAWEELRLQAVEEQRQAKAKGVPDVQVLRGAGNRSVPAQARSRSQHLTTVFTGGSRGETSSAAPKPQPGHQGSPAQPSEEADGPDTDHQDAADDGGDGDGASDGGGSERSQHVRPSHERSPSVTASTIAQDQHTAPGDRGSDDGAQGVSENASERLAAAAQHLAEMVSLECEGQASDRDLQFPLPIPLTWRLVEQRPAVVSVAVTGRRRNTFRPLPGATAATAETVQTGGPEELFGLYAGLASGRIVVTGRQGRGKTSMAILTALEALDSRGALPREQRWQVPVPVLLTADSWNPQHQDLRTWLADQLAVRYGFLTSDAYGSDAAGQLVARGKIALFLEGLDQMGEGLRQAALQQLASEHAIRTVVMSRPRQYAAAVAAVPLPGALVIELMPVPLQDALEYLQRRQYGPAEHMTVAVVQHLQQHPDSPLAQALDSPLSLTLLRADPHANQALLTGAGVHTRREVEDLLLDRLVPRAYSAERPEGLTAEQNRPWQTRIDATRTVLELIAARMTETGTTGLAWWRMHYWEPARWRIGANTAAGIIIMGAIGMLVFGPIGKYTVNGHTGLQFGLKYGAFMGLCFGSLAGAISEVRDLRPARLARLDKMLEHCPERAKRRWPQLGSAASALALFNPAIALLIFTVMIMAVGNQSGWPILGHLLFGVPAGLLAAAVTGRAAARERLLPISRSRWIILRPTRADLLAAGSTGLPVGLTYALTKTTEFGLWAGLFTGFTFGLMTAVARPISNPDTPATPFTRRRDDRRRARRTALVVAVPIGVALGLQNGLAHGPLAGITATLGLATIIALGCMGALSDSWRTTLAFTQLHLHGRWQRFRGDQNATVFPLHGMRFLKEACAKEVMRNSGPLLTFWHTQLQHMLADAYTRRATATRQTSREDHPTPHS